MISKRLDVRKVNWRGVKASRSISAPIWEQVGSNHALQPALLHVYCTSFWIPHCECTSTSTRNLTFQPASLILTCHIPPEEAESVHIAKPRLVLAGHLAAVMQAPSPEPGAQAYTLLLCTSMLWCKREGGCLHMHACQAYLRHANYHCSLQNRARVLPSGALFEYFVLSPFFTRTAIYFFTTGSWGYNQNEYTAEQKWYEFVFHRFPCTAMSIPMRAQLLALTKSSTSFALSCCWLQLELFCKPHRRVTISMTSEN